MKDLFSIQKAMDYLASTGNCVAMLPNAHYIIHLSDTFLQKLEEINMNALVPPYPPSKLNQSIVFMECFISSFNAVLLHNFRIQP